MFGSIIKGITSTVSDLVEDPVGTTVGMAMQPVRDTLDLVEGITEGELRLKVAARLGADVVAGMALSEVIEAMTTDELGEIG